MFATYAKDYFGAVLNEKKSYTEKTGGSLQIVWLTIFLCTDFFIIASLLYPEWKSDEGRIMARAVGIAYANWTTPNSLQDLLWYTQISGIIRFQYESERLASNDSVSLNLQRFYFWEVLLDTEISRQRLSSSLFISATLQMVAWVTEE